MPWLKHLTPALLIPHQAFPLWPNDVAEVLVTWTLWRENPVVLMSPGSCGFGLSFSFPIVFPFAFLSLAA